MKINKLLMMRLAAAAVTVASILIFAPWQFGLYYLSPLPLTVEEQVSEAAEQGLDGIIVYVQRADHSGEFYAAGWHDRDQKIPARPKAFFKIASIEKLYTASAIAKLVASGRLSLDDSLADYLPSLVGRVEHADQITLKMMVQHRSGIPNYTDQGGFSWSEMSIGVLDNLNLVLDTPADFMPGSDYSYSNTNYLLLGMIMTETLGYPHTRYIKEEILIPLGLSRTFFSVNDIDPTELMSGRHIGYDADLKELDQGFVAAAEDVGIFLRALNDGTLLSSREQEIYASLYEFGHTGWVLGYSSRAHYHKDIDAVVIQFVNTTGNDTVMLTGIVYDRIIEILRKRNDG